MWTGLDGFPAFCTGETVFSVLAEFTKRVHPESNAAWLKELFGNSYQTAITDLASNLYELEQRIPAVYGYDADYMINWHTTAPYHRLGQSESQTQKLYKAMKVKSFNATNVHIYAGNMHSGIRRPSFSRACTICIGVDRKKYGRTYWHRGHQLPGIEVCPLHGIYLTEVNLRNTHRHTFVTLDDPLATQAPIEPATDLSDTRLIHMLHD